MKKLLLSLLLTTAFHSPAHAALTTVKDIPQQLVQQMRSGSTQEAFLYKTMRSFPATLTSIDNAYIEMQAKKFEAAYRAQSVGKLLAADLDADGKVTYAEIEAFLRVEQSKSNRVNYQLDAWKKLDTNNDEIITYDEMREIPSNAAGKTSVLENLLALDPNKDGTLTRAELRELAQQAYDLVDTNHDYILSEDEKMVLIKTSSPPAYQRHVRQLEMKLDADEELHVVGVYEGNEKTAGKVHGPEVKVHIDRPGKKVALLLTSYDSVKWLLTTTPKTSISHIYVSLTANRIFEVMLNDKKYTDSILVNAPMAYKTKGTGFRELLASIQRATGRDKVDSFHGEYRQPEGKIYTISEVSKNAEMKENRLELQVADAKNLPNYTFFGVINGISGEYSLSGKLKSPSQPHLLNAAYVPAKKEYYSIKNNGIAHYDAGGAELEQIPLSLDVPTFSHPRGIAYNSKENALAIVSLGGEGFLYHYDLDDKKWSAVSLNNADYNTLAYDETSGNYIASPTFGTNGATYINAKTGAPAERVTIDFDKFPGFKDTYDPGNNHPNYRVIPHGDKLVFVSYGGHPMAMGNAVRRVYLYDRKTGDVQLTYFN